MKRALTIAGSDSGGGAGIQADLKTFSALGVYGMSAITALTAQNTLGVQAVYELPALFVAQQIDSVVTDIGVDAVKTGMLANSEIIHTVAEKVKQYNLPNLVVDPVMRAKSGDPLIRPEAQETLVKELFPLAMVVTPNLPEAEALVGFPVKTLDDMRRAAVTIHEMGPAYVVVKGGHLEGDISIDVLYNGERWWEFTAPHIKTRNTHGTGCSFASAIAAWLARGADVPEAVKRAKEYLTEALRYGAQLHIGGGHGPVHHFAILYKKMGWL